MTAKFANQEYYFDSRGILWKSLSMSGEQEMIEKTNEEGIQKSIALWRLPTVQQVTGLGRSSIYQLMSEGKFPRQIRYHGRAAWVSSDVESWIHQQIEASRKAEGTHSAS